MANLLLDNDNFNFIKDYLNLTEIDIVSHDVLNPNISFGQQDIELLNQHNVYLENTINNYFNDHTMRIFKLALQYYT